MRGLFIAEASLIVDGRRLAAYATGAPMDVARGEPRILVPDEWVSWARAACTGWNWQDDTLLRELRFRDFDEGWGFVDEIAQRAQDYKRRPDVWISGNRVELVIRNPHHAGITLAELRLAAKVNAVVEERERQP